MVALKLAEIISSRRLSASKKITKIFSTMIYSLCKTVSVLTIAFAVAMIFTILLEGSDTVSDNFYNAYGDTALYQRIASVQDIMHTENNVDTYEIEDCEMWANIQTETDTIRAFQIIELQNRIDELPEEIKDDIADLPIYLSDDYESFDKGDGNSYAGWYSHTVGVPEDNFIRLRADCTQAIYHEMGHFVQFNCEAVKDEDVKTLCELESDILVNNYAHNDYYRENKEFFAESFELYVTNPNEMIKTMPVTYDFIEQVLACYE